MALQSDGPIIWPWYTSANVFTPSTLTIDAADEIAGGVFTISKAGTVVRVHFCTSTVTTGADVDVRLETLDASGQNSGTLFGTNTNVTQTIADANDNTWFRTNTLTGSATVAVGDKIAVLVKNPSSSFGNMQIRRGVASPGTTGYPYSVGPLVTNKNDLQTPLICALEYNDGSFATPFLTLPIQTASTVTANTGTNPDEIATIFTPTFKMRAAGASFKAATAAGADYRVQIYEDGNNTPIASLPRDGDHTTNTASRDHFDFFTTPVELDAGTTYRLALLPTTANSVTVPYFEVSSSYLGLLDCLPGGQAMHYSARNRTSTTDPDAAAWSQTTNRRLGLGLVLDQLDDGAGGGAASMMRPVPMQGGFV